VLLDELLEVDIVAPQQRTPDVARGEHTLEALELRRVVVWPGMHDSEAGKFGRLRNIFAGRIAWLDKKNRQHARQPAGVVIPVAARLGLPIRPCEHHHTVEMVSQTAHKSVLSGLTNRVEISSPRSFTRCAAPEGCALASAIEARCHGACSEVAAAITDD